jgi:dTDP-4-amino-4,6-dideoxygalactose transaminase
MRVFLIDDVTPAELAEVKAQMDLAEVVGNMEDQNAAEAVSQLASLHRLQEKKGQVVPSLRGFLQQLAGAKPRTNGKAADTKSS